jgi:hypothetical protein
MDGEQTGDEDIILVKTDSVGNEEWKQIIDISQNIDLGSGVLPSTSGYVVVGTTSNGNDFDGVYFETDMQGVPINSQFYTIDEEGGNENFENIEKLAQGGYIITGSTDAAEQEGGQTKFDEQDFLTIKIFDDLSEDPNWEVNKVNGRQGSDIGIRSFENPADPSRIVTFGSTDTPEEDVTKWNLWTFNALEFDGSATGSDYYYGDTENQVCFDVSVRPGGFLITGTKNIGQGVNEMYFVRTRGINETEVSISVFTELNLSLEGRSIVSSVDNQVIHLGEITYPNGNTDIFLGKTDINGGSIWSETFGNSGLNRASKVVQNPDGSIVFTGTMNLSGQNKIFLIKTNENGQLEL